MSLWVIAAIIGHSSGHVWLTILSLLGLSISSVAAVSHWLAGIPDEHDTPGAALPARAEP